eukprot:10714877-Karenia_brevis.AAC.1
MSLTAINAPTKGAGGFEPGPEKKPTIILQTDGVCSIFDPVSGLSNDLPPNRDGSHTGCDWGVEWSKTR